MENIKYIEFKEEYKEEYAKKIYDFVFKIMIKDVGKAPSKLKEELKDLEDISNVYIGRNGNFFIAVNQENNIIGTIGLLYKRDRFEVKRFYVESTFRGKGIGKKLYSMVENKLKEKDIKELYIVVGNNLVDAKKMYIRWGFKESKVQKDKNNTELKKDLNIGNI